jgi:hypothetical protein
MGFGTACGDDASYIASKRVDDNKQTPVDHPYDREPLFSIVEPVIVVCDRKRAKTSLAVSKLMPCRVRFCFAFA